MSFHEARTSTQVPIYKEDHAVGSLRRADMTDLAFNDTVLHGITFHHFLRVGE